MFTHIFWYEYACLYIYVIMHTDICRHVYTHILIHIYMYTLLYIPTYTFLHMYWYKQASLHKCAYSFMYIECSQQCRSLHNWRSDGDFCLLRICISIHIHGYTYVYMYNEHVQRRPCRSPRDRRSACERFLLMCRRVYTYIFIRMCISRHLFWDAYVRMYNQHVDDAGIVAIWGAIASFVCCFRYWRWW